MSPFQHLHDRHVAGAIQLAALACNVVLLPFQAPQDAKTHTGRCRIWQILHTAVYAGLPHDGILTGPCSPFLGVARSYQMQLHLLLIGQILLGMGRRARN